MRIDGQAPSTDTEAARRLDSTNPADRTTGPGAARAGASSDRVEVSTDAQLVAAAIRAAESTPSIRPDAVERAREALESGTLGRNSERLADRLIDAMLGE